MKYMITFNERPQGSALEYEHAQKRILDVFQLWEQPANLTIEMYVIRVGDWGGYLLVECDDPIVIHKLCSLLPALEFQVKPVMIAEDAIRAELEVIAWRDSLKFG